jgi:hypothetical protein
VRAELQQRIHRNVDNLEHLPPARPSVPVLFRLLFCLRNSDSSPHVPEGDVLSSPISRRALTQQRPPGLSIVCGNHLCRPTVLLLLCRVDS